MDEERVRELEEQGHRVEWTVLNGERVWIVDGEFQDVHINDEFEIVKVNEHYEKQRKQRRNR